jgi:hypothetical protein
MAIGDGLVGRYASHMFSRHPPRKRGIQYAAAYQFIISVSGILGRPVKPGDDSDFVEAGS